MGVLLVSHGQDSPETPESKQMLFPPSIIAGRKSCRSVDTPQRLPRPSGLLPRSPAAAAAVRANTARQRQQGPALCLPPIAARQATRAVPNGQVHEARRGTASSGKVALGGGRVHDSTDTPAPAPPTPRRRRHRLGLVGGPP